MATGVDDLLEELRNLGYPDVRDRLLHLGRGHRCHAGEATEALGHVRRGVPEHRELQVAHRLLVDHVEAPEGEEQVGLHTFTQSGVGQDEARVGHVQVSLGADDRKLATALLLPEGRDDGGGLGDGHGCLLFDSHATAGLRKPGDVGHLLGRLLGKEGEELLGRDLSDVATRRKVGVSSCTGKSLRRNRIAFQCSSSISTPIWAASAVPAPRSTRRTGS